MVILFHKYLDECLKRQDTSISMFKVEDDTESIDAKMLISAKLLERMVGEDEIGRKYKMGRKYKIRMTKYADLTSAKTTFTSLQH